MAFHLRRYLSIGWKPFEETDVAEVSTPERDEVVRSRTTTVAKERARHDPTCHPSMARNPYRQGEGFLAVVAARNDTPSRRSTARDRRSFEAPEDSPLVKATQAAGGPRKPTRKVITNDDVKKNALPSAATSTDASAPPPDTKTATEKFEEQRKASAAAQTRIVGFPGETEEDFAQTLSLIEEVRYGSLFAFKYSPRPGTPSLKLGAPVGDAVASERLTRLFELHERIKRERLESYRGRVLPVLVEGPSRNDPSMFAGRTDDNFVVNFVAVRPPMLGSMLGVRIDQAQHHTLRGEAVA